MAQVGSLKHAIRAEQDGADLVVAAGHEAGGHVGPTGTTVLTPLISSRVRIPVVAAGGFCDGMGLVAALALGAEGVALGTRFAATRESGLPEALKRRYVEAGEADTLVTRRITGSPLRVIHNQFTDRLEGKAHDLPLLERVQATLQMRRQLGVSWWRFVVGGWRMKKDYEASFSSLGTLAGGVERIDRAFKDGDVQEGAVIAGQVCARIDDVPFAAEVVERIVAEASKVYYSLQGKMAN